MVIQCVSAYLGPFAVLCPRISGQRSQNLAREGLCAELSQEHSDVLVADWADGRVYGQSAQGSYWGYHFESPALAEFLWLTLSGAIGYSPYHRSRAQSCLIVRVPGGACSRIPVEWPSKRERDDWFGPMKVAER